ncbi:AraC family transcriptional regulator [Brucella daejeonensis]|uniref:AraC family transcriptional regulator n=1 Tax=Brucella daejeonensis TaxID=659015 RepID=UPI0016162D2C|nr:AraC family transcriptional regulator [Brucella daejeonensis]
MTANSTGDLLSALAPLLRVRPVLEDFCRFGGEWASPHAQLEQGWAQFHIVTRGTCIVERIGQENIRLDAGDILLLPHGDGHFVRSRTGTGKSRMIAEFRNAIRNRSTVDIQPDTELVCGQLEFEAGKDSPLIAILPDTIVLHTADEPLLERFGYLLGGIREELDTARAGSEIVAADLARALFVLMIRFHLEQMQELGDMLPMLKNPVASRVVLALLHDPARDWSLEAMAETGITSRATLVRTFRNICGKPPMAFLQDIRLALARQQLIGTNESIAKIASRIGYQSEGAFSRAFYRHHGIRPGALRNTNGEVRMGDMQVQT